MRWLLGLCALPVAGYGVWLLLSRQDLDQLTNAGLWLVSGVVAHDLAIAGVALLVGLVLTRLPAVSRAPAAVALVVVGTLTLVAQPAMTGFGKVTGNPTHLDRPYVAAWLSLVGASVLIVVLTSVLRLRKKED